MRPAICLPPATKLGQNNIFTGVCDSVNGGRGVCSRGVSAPEGCLLGGCLLRGCVPGGDPPTPTAPPGWLLLRAVRILLECILVRNVSTKCVSPFFPVIITARKRSLRRLCFYTCLSFCPQGVCVWLLRGMVAPGGHVWLLWGVHGCSGGGGMHGCSQGGHVWLLQGGMCGCSWGGMPGCFGGMHGCSGGVCIGYDKIWRYGQ